MLSRWRERGETRPLVRACEVVICCWAVRSVARRGVWRGRARRGALFVSGRAVLKSKRVCVRACRAAGYALWAGRK